MSQIEDFDDLKPFAILIGNIDNGLAYVTEWNNFVLYPNTCIKSASYRTNSINDDIIVKSVLQYIIRKAEQHPTGCCFWFPTFSHLRLEKITYTYITLVRSR